MVGPDGNRWFNPAFAPELGKVTPAGVVSFFPIPTRAEGIASGPRNTLLFTEFGVDKIASITTDGVVTESPEIPRSEPTGITPGPRRTAWFLGYGNDRVYTTPIPQ